MPSRCPHCGSDRPPIDDPAFRVACPACGGPRLPADTVYRDDATRRASDAALVRARRAARRGRFLMRLVGMCAATMTALLALAALQGAHIQFMSLLAMGLLWTSFTISYRRRHAITARRASGDLDAAYSLAGATLPATGVGMGVTATPQVRISTDVPAHLAISARPAFEAEAEATAKAEAEAEADREDAFTDFDRRLAEAEKRK